MDVVMRHPVADAVRLLVAGKFDRRLGESPLIDAIETGNVEIAHILVDADVNVNCHSGALTPLVAAVETRNLPLITYLEDHEAREKP